MTRRQLSRRSFAAAAFALALPAAARLAGFPARAQEADRRWSRTLACGATVEVVAVSPHPSTPGSWWGPSGKPLEKAPCDPYPGRVDGGDESVARAVLVRVTNLPEDASFGWSVKESNGVASFQPRLNKKPLPDAREMVVILPKGQAACTVRFEVAAKPWETVVDWNGQGATSVARDKAAGPSYSLSEGVETKRGCVVAVMHNIEARDVRVSAVDRGGQEHRASHQTGGGIHGLSQLVSEFNLPPARVREFRLQARPFETTEIEDVVIDPAAL